MSLLTSSIDLETIEPPKSEEISQFPKSQIESLAKFFVEAGDTVRPILLRKVSPVSFQVLEGHFEYCAALKAQEIDDQFTAIRAYVVPPDLERTFLEQYQFMRTLSPVSNPPSTPDSLDQLLKRMEASILNGVERKLTVAIENKISSLISSHIQEFSQKTTEQFEEIKKSISLLSKPEPNPPGKPPIRNIFNESDPKNIEVLNDLNTMNISDLSRKFTQSKNGRFAQKIDELRTQQPFSTISDVVNRVNGIGQVKMQQIIAAW
jgi:hypothetical protein